MARPPGVTEFMLTRAAAPYRDPLAPNERDVFWRVALSPGTMTTKIAEEMNITPEAVSRIVKKLINLGWVMERVDKADRRIKRLGATAEGYRAARLHFDHLHGQKPGTVQRIGGFVVWDGETPFEEWVKRAETE